MHRGDQLKPHGNYMTAVNLADGTSRDVEQATVYALLAIADELCHVATMLKEWKAA